MNTAPLLNKNCSTEFNRDTAYWNEYYKKNTPESMPESNFASFVKKYLKSGKTLVDLGCGNGRDSLYFSKLGVNVIGIDASDTSIAKLNSLKIKNASFICGNFISCPLIYAKKVEYFYSRFSIHAIDEKGEDIALRVARGIVTKFFDGFTNSKKLKARLSSELNKFEDYKRIISDYNKENLIE